MTSASEDDLMDTAGDVDDDLFGSDDAIEKARELSDRDLDSGDDEGRHDRAPTKPESEEVEYASNRSMRFLQSTVWRHPLPNPSDGEFNTLRLPKFLGIEPRPYIAATFELPVADHHTTTKSAGFSACATAISTMRFRKKPSDNQLESNTVMYKWSDGSTTISVGDQHYELQTKPLAPPKDNKTYQEVQDSHTYVASPSIQSQLLMMVGHMTNQYTVRPNKTIEDDALEKLQRSLAAATRGGNKNDDKNGPQVITNTQDPELEKKKAEMAEKERMKIQRRRETAAEKASIPSGRRLGGLLGLDDLEGRGGRRAPGSGRKPAGAKRPRRRPEYDSDDDLPRGRNREDEYDKEDDFLASSDEELEDGGEGDDDDEDELADDGSESEEPKAKKQKQSDPDDLSDADADAEADLDDDQAPFPPVTKEPAGVRGRKRNVIEDDEDE